jgi:hypothetical protein
MEVYMAETETKTDQAPETIEVPDPKATVAVPTADGETTDIPLVPAQGVSRALLPEDFVSEDLRRVNEERIIEAARQLKIEPELLLAFTKVESPKGPYLPDGRPNILFEAHVFSRNTSPAHKFDDTHPSISSRSWNRSLYGKGGANQYTRLFKAMALDPRAALMACSWGSWQVLGENYAHLGFKTVQDFVLFCVASEANQFEVFLREVKYKKGLLRALQQKDFDDIAYLYNGAGYRANKYDEKIQAEYEALTSNVLRRGSQGPKVVSLQKMLNLHGASPAVAVDGWFGAATDAAVRDLQSRWGVTIDGVVGPETYERLATERLEDEGNPWLSKRAAGVAVTVTTGGAAIGQGISDLGKAAGALKEVATLDRLKELQDTTTVTREVVGTAKDAAEHVVGVQQGTSMTLIFVGVVIIAIAAFFAWTKYYDNRKSQGVG